MSDSVSAQSRRQLRGPACAAVVASRSSSTGDSRNRSTFRASSDPTVAWKFSLSSGSFTQLTRPNPQSSSVQLHRIAAPTCENREVFAYPAAGICVTGADERTHHACGKAYTQPCFDQVSGSLMHRSLISRS